MKLIKGYTAITVKGLNIEKLINRLSKEGIAIYRASTGTQEAGFLR